MNSFMQKGVENFSIYFRPRIYMCGLLSFSSGFSVLFIVCAIPIWLKDFGVSKTMIGWFSIAYLPYVLKVLWAPFMAISVVPWFGKWLGHLRGWAFVMQIGVIFCIFLLSFINPAANIVLAWFAIFFMAFFSASRDIVTDAYRVEILESSEVAPGSAMYLLGYRIGMLTSSAGSLFLADFLPWNMVFYILNSLLLLGIIIILLIPEPNVYRAYKQLELKVDFSWLDVLKTRLKIAVKSPFMEFMSRKGWLLMLLLIPIYKLGDNFIQSMSNLFFLDIGFSKTDIASTVKIFGLIASIVGSIWGGIIVNKIGDLKSMFFNGIIHMLAFGTFILQAVMGDNIFLLYLTIAVTHVTGGIVTTAFVSYISNLCHSSHKVTQYALFSSLRSLDKCLTFPAGLLADHVRWTTYFIITPLLGIPALIIIFFMLTTKKVMRVLTPQTST